MECDDKDKNGCTNNWNNYEEEEGNRCKTTSVSDELFCHFKVYGVESEIASD